MTTTLEEVIQSITEAKVDHAIRDARDIEIGQVVHQGDIYLHRVADDHPRGALLGTRKLAVGQGEGSNHMAEGDGVEVYAGERLPKWVKEPEWMQPGQMLGPVVVARGEWTNTHTVHAHNVCRGSATYQVTYQGDMLTQRRVED